MTVQTMTRNEVKAAASSLLALSGVAGQIGSGLLMGLQGVENVEQELPLLGEWAPCNRSVVQFAVALALSHDSELLREATKQATKQGKADPGPDIITSLVTLSEKLSAFGGIIPPHHDHTEDDDDNDDTGSDDPGKPEGATGQDGASVFLDEGLN